MDVKIILDKESVVVAHPGKQHFYRVVLAVDSAGLPLGISTTAFLKGRSRTQQVDHLARLTGRETFVWELRCTPKVGRV